MPPPQNQCLYGYSRLLGALQLPGVSLGRHVTQFVEVSFPFW